MRSISVFVIAVLAAMPAMAHEPAAPRDLDREAAAIRADERALAERKRELRHSERDLSESRFRRLGPEPFWFSVGLNGSHVEKSEEGCGGAQGGITMGNTLMLKLQYSAMSYEADDDTETCDGIVSGDSSVDERAALGGLFLGRSGLYVAGGPARVHQDVLGQPTRKDTGTRMEIGWTSRQVMNSVPGVEVVLFRTRNDLADYNGVAVNLTLGNKR